MAPKHSYEDLLPENPLANGIHEGKKIKACLIEPDELIDGFFMTDEIGTITFCNKALVSMHGYENLDELKGRHFSELISPEARDEMVAIYMNAVNNNDFPDRLEIPVINKNGSIFYIELKAAPVLEEGRIVGTRGINRDITERKVVEAALRENMDQYRLIASHISDIVWQLDKNLKFVFISPSVTRILGYSIEEIIGREFIEFLDEIGLEQVKSYIQKRLQFDQAPVKANEYKMRHKNGHWMHMEVTFSPIFIDGSAVGFTGVARDISARRQMENHLNASEKRYRDLVENMSEVLYVIDRSGILSFVSPSVRDLAQFSPAEVTGRCAGDFMHKEDLPRYLLSFQEALAGKEISRNEYRIITRSGDIRWVETSSRPVKAGTEIIGVQGLLLDITEKKLVEQALQENINKYSTIFNTVRDIIYTISLDRKLISINPAVEKAMGWSPEELIGKTITSMIHPDDLDLADSQFGQIRSGNIVSPTALRILTKSGEYRSLEFIPTPLHKNGKLAGLHGIARDVTERKRAEDELIRAKEELESRVRERTLELTERVNQLSRMSALLTLAEHRERQRLAKILHDHLQQLLVGAKINSEVLSTRLKGEQKQIAEAVLDLINQSIKTSRSLTAELAPPVLEQGISAVLEWTCRRIKETHGLTVLLKKDPCIDPRREDTTIFLYQSVKELLLNVAKHAGVKSACIEMSQDGLDKLRVTVSDRGSGFDPAVVLQKGGNRYGLFSIRERIEDMGGSLHIESSPGNGASFTLIVPVETREEQDEEGIQKNMIKVQKTKTSGEMIRVLLVDDHKVVRQGLSTMLNLYPDIQIVGEAADGMEAVEKAMTLQPDVILMDITMPKMDGFEATRIIHSELPHIRIIGLSMHDKQDQADRMTEAGASAYCTKDGDTDVLLSAIRAGAQNRHINSLILVLTLFVV